MHLPNWILEILLLIQKFNHINRCIDGKNIFKRGGHTALICPEAWLNMFFIAP